MKIAEASSTSVNHLWSRAESRVAGAGVLEEKLHKPWPTSCMTCFRTRL